MSIKYENYEIKREDERNWSLVRHDTITANRDILKPGTSEVIHKEGDQYPKAIQKGYFSDVPSAIQAIYRDKLGENCETIKEVIKQSQELRQSLIGLATAN